MSSIQNTGQVKVRYSDVSIIRMLVIQIPLYSNPNNFYEFQHFDEDDYLTERMDTNPHRKKGPLKVRRLRPDAVPHIFPG